MDGRMSHVKNDQASLYSALSSLLTANEALLDPSRLLRRGQWLHHDARDAPASGLDGV